MYDVAAITATYTPQTKQELACNVTHRYIQRESLSTDLRVPVTVIDDDCISSSESDALSTRSC